MIIIQCVLSPSIFKPLTLFTSFLKDNICWNLQTTEAKVIYLQTATSPRLGPSLQKHIFFFFTLGSVNLQSSTARTDPSVTVSGVANIPRPNLPCTKAKQQNPDRLYLRNYTFDLAIERLKKKQTETNTTLQLLQNVLLGEEEKWCFPVSPSGDIKMTSMSFFLWFAQLMSSHHFLSTSNTCLYFIICVQLHFI